MAEEIKSALEIALEKAERIGKASKEELELYQLKEEAQRLSAKFLRNELSDFEDKFNEFLQNKTSQQKRIIYQSVIDVFLKNIVLPKSEYQLEDGKKALEGLKIIFKRVPELSKVYQQIEKLLKEYYTHRETLHDELLKRFNTGVEALEHALSDQLGTEVKINVEEHPQFKEEWNKIKEKLDEEYGKQLEYLKNLFRKIIP